MLPSLVAEDLRNSLTSFLGTTFALADDDVRAELERFIGNPHDGVFRGPYVRLRTPFRPADDTWRDHLDWAPTDFHPHKHQADAWMRLGSRDRLPKPTLVTTGTGSGKTESFLIPLLEHCRRERLRGRHGIKALVLYPMNALANDQARRIARLAHEHGDELGGVTVGLYTGDSGSADAMTETSVIESKHAMRQSPPDVLLTNYKMLDMLLLRSEDAPLFAHAGESLRYLVLDEFHTYDGAQGTDVAMLLRRLGAVLGVATDERPLGAITPVATSATLGSGEGPGAELRQFARTVFGAEFNEDALVGEDRLTADEWVTAPPQGAVPLLDEVTTALRGVTSHEDQLRLGARLFLRGAVTDDEIAALDVEALGRALRAHPLTQTLLNLTATPRPLADLAAEAEPSWAIGTKQRHDSARHAISLFLALLSRARTGGGHPLLTVDVQLWLREVSRLLRTLSSSPRFAWFEGAQPEDGERSLPSIFCRHCGRSGWGVVATPGGSHAIAPNAVWSKSASDASSARAWIFAPGEADKGSDEVRWVDPEIADFVPGRSGKHSTEVPVLVTPDSDAARDQQCPSCGQKDAIRFLGSRVATLASATLGQLFGSPDVAPDEKKTLVFTDSVQDASHRAAFVESRAYALNLRALVHRAIGGGTTLDVLGDAVEAAGRTAEERFATLPPDLREHETFARYAADDPEPHVRRAVATRMGFAATLELGLSSRTGRTLELTGAATAHVEIDDLDAVVRRATDDAARRDVQLSLDGVGPQRVRAWARGVTERIRLQGGIGHRWLDRFAESDDRYPIWGGRPRREGMPAFPGSRAGRTGRPAPSFPTTARHTENFDSVVTPRSWYATWTARVLGVPTVDGPRYMLALLDALAADGALVAKDGAHGSVVWWIPPERVRVAPTVGSPARLRCSACSTLFPGPCVVLDDLLDAPCQRDRCPGVYREERADYDYYRELYRAGEVRRIIAREHTSLLPADERVALENRFKGGTGPGAPNVLTCTPTLELGIDIGDLSTVALTSLPRSTASYLQRVGRAGRLTGNALVVSLLPARPLELQRLADPLTMIAGEVVPPACYLDATEILRRQYFASLVDRRARSGHAAPTRFANEVFRGGLTPTSWLGALVADARANAESYVHAFLRGFGDEVSKDSAGALREWAGDGGPEGEPPGLERDVEAAVAAWNAEGEELAERIERVKVEVEAMEARPSLDDAGRRELRRLFGELGAARAARRKRDDMYWISALEARGLLPNYALLDDTTTLDVGLWWIDEETGEHQSEEDQYVRGSRTALGELAPGATFYVRGTAVDIDGVDLGTSRNPATERRRFCPACGWSRRVGDGDVAVACPRCGAPAAADAGQVLTTVPFRRASAYASRETALREDDGEDRRKARFSVITTVDADPQDISGAWRLREYPFGVEVLRRADIRWINLGPQDRGGATITVAGHETAAPQFVACRHCGVVPAAQRGVQDLDGARHRGWCRQRREPDPNAWVTISLTHELRTQAVRLLVPPIVVADATVRTSFRAALLLGLREVLGGEPEHLDVVEAADPAPGSSERWVMVLHDLVPGGTGYLERFADADGVRELLEAAVAVLDRCPCRAESLAACHRCLLPHVVPHLAGQARRDTALGLIADIFRFWEPEPVEAIQRITVGPHDTPIEKRFRALLLQWAKGQGAAVTTTATTYGDSAQLRFPAKHGDRQWQLTPQVKLGGVQPDFVLDCNDHAVPRIAVFCDGRRYHSSPDHNRLADDATKRASLRDQGYLVWAVTHQDLDAFALVLNGDAGSGNQAVDDGTRAVAVQLTQRLAVPGSRTADVVLADPISALADFVLRPSTEAWTPAAHALALVLGKKAPAKVRHDAIRPTLRAALTGDERPHAPGDVPAVLTRSARGAMLLVERRTTTDVRVRLGVDDRDEVIGSDAQVDAWRDWLALGNIFQFLEPGRFSADTTTTLGGVAFDTTDALPIDPVWRDIADTFDGELRETVLALAAAGVPAPDAGLELDGGDIIVDLAWPADQVAVLLEADDDATGWLTEHGWTVVEPDEQAVRAALSPAGGA